MAKYYSNTNYKVLWKINCGIGNDKRLRVGSTTEMRPELDKKKEDMAEDV